MSGPKRNPDRLNTIGVVVVGVCGAVLVYVSIVALQAFYVDDTSEIQTMADYGGQDIQARNVRMSQSLSLNAPSTPNPRVMDRETYRVPLKSAMKHIVETLKADPKTTNLVPSIDLTKLPKDQNDHSTTKAVFGRPIPLHSGTPAPAPAGGEGSGSAAPDPTRLTPTGGTGPGGGNPPQQPEGTTAPTVPQNGSGSAPKGNGR